MFQPLRFVTAGILLSGAATFYASPVRSTAADLPVKSKTILTTVKPAPLKQPAGTFSVLPLESSTVSRRVDALISLELSQAKVVPASKTSDEDFLRRVTFDLAGTAPTPAEVDVFGIDPDPQKRSRVIDRLLASDDYARNWSQYWREVIYSRATDPRSQITRAGFEEWLEQKFATNVGWDKIATELLTAQGDVREVPQTALIFAQGGEPEEVASEASRIFLGIQIQCANCHDHPTDSWKREQFHQLTAFFPRVSLRPKPNATPRSFEIASVDGGRGGRAQPFGGPQGIVQNPEPLFQRLDRNRDGKLVRAEVNSQPLERLTNLLFQQADSNKDGALTVAEIKAMPLPNQAGRGTLEHFMPDPTQPNAQGQLMQPVFFVNGWSTQPELNDQDRRAEAARFITSPENPWFAKALVNRLWGEMLGEAFYMPIDDIGPERTASHPEVLELLANQFAAHQYDTRWLFRTIANTETYQRQLRATVPTGDQPAFASAALTRLRSDQLYNSLMTVLGIDELGNPTQRQRAQGAGARYADRSPRGQFNTVFGFDPSTPQADLTGTIPQALFFINSPLLQNLISSRRDTRLARIVQENPDNHIALSELYLLVLSREPTEKEQQICLEYIQQAPSRGEAFEDLMWSLLNSSEFLTKR